ncbi:MAG: NAD(+) synthase [Verrucomicrobia bacterium]|nr:MAG: NAD(+) synthase [Verrucomicrobiota bacterium]
MGFAQINPTVGDLRGNFEKIAGAYDQLARAGADIVIAPELAVTGYPPQDLVFKSRFVPENLAMLDELQRRLKKPALLVGFVDRNQGRGKPFHNAAALLQAGEPLQKTHKSLLPTYDVFDEDRYFEPAREIAPLKFRGHRIGVTICEDIWTERYLPRPFYDVDPVRALVTQEAEMILNVSASPFSLRKPAVRREMISGLAGTYQRPIFYCNAVGGNDQLVFDGNSIAVNARGQLLAQLPAFEEASVIVDSESVPGSKIAPVLGLSGGIDSAVVAAIAVDALGPNNVTGVSMPSQFSSRGSILDALALTKNLRIQCLEIPIADAFAVFKAQFKEVFAGRTEDATEENMQARLRGMTLMALSNKFGHLVLSTGNKSELAVGYCTIYGDMAGGLAVISDVPKTMIYELAHFINSEASRAGEGEIIPASTIEKAPSAELRPNQKDQDTLPPYDVLDAILRLYVEDNLSVAEIVAQGFDEKTVRWVQRRVDLNEYKRAQAAPGLRVTSRAFGLGRRMPIAQRYVG